VLTVEFAVAAPTLFSFSAAAAVLVESSPVESPDAPIGADSLGIWAIVPAEVGVDVCEDNDARADGDELVWPASAGIELGIFAVAFVDAVGSAPVVMLITDCDAVALPAFAEIAPGSPLAAPDKIELFPIVPVVVSEPGFATAAVSVPASAGLDVADAMVIEFPLVDPVVEPFTESDTLASWLGPFAPDVAIDAAPDTAP
jgi:hypothetical protein